MGIYIVELKKNETLYKATTRESDGTAYVCSAIGTPYTAPDLEQVRKEVYQKGRKDVETQFCSYDACKNRQEEYQRGLADAWEAARKIVLDTDKGGIPLSKLQQIFHRGLPNEIIGAFSVAEAIKKVRQYEQEKDRQARIEYNFDEIKDVLETTANECNVSLDEISEVLQKMKESDNG